MKVLLDLNEHLVDVMAIESVGPHPKGGTMIQMMSGSHFHFAEMDLNKAKKIIQTVLVQAGKQVEENNKVTPIRRTTRKK